VPGRRAASGGRVPRLGSRLAGALFLITWLMPRRLPDLARFTASAGFRSYHAVAVDWTGRQLVLIENGAPWLDLAGRWVDDYCQVRQDKGWDLRPTTIGVQCLRTVTAVYGADGALPARLAELGAVLGAAGWGDFFSYGAPHIARGSLDSQRPPVTGHWQHAPFPAGQEALPPAAVKQARSLKVGWTSRDQPADPHWTLDGSWHAGRTGVPSSPRLASRHCQPVDCDKPELDELASRALAAHEHAIVIVIPISYYFNPDTRRFPMRRTILPVLPRKPATSRKRG
jgi:hypothetical protein